MFSLRYSLFAIDNLLLGVTSLLFTAHLLFGSCFSLVGSSFSSLTLAAYRSLAQCLQHAIGYSPSLLTVYRSQFWVFATRRWPIAVPS